MTLGVDSIKQFMHCCCFALIRKCRPLKSQHSVWVLEVQYLPCPCQGLRWGCSNSLPCLLSAHFLVPGPALTMISLLHVSASFRAPYYHVAVSTNQMQGYPEMGTEQGQTVLFLKSDLASPKTFDRIYNFLLGELSKTDRSQANCLSPLFSGHSISVHWGERGYRYLSPVQDTSQWYSEWDSCGCYCITHAFLFWCLASGALPTLGRLPLLGLANS